MADLTVTASGYWGDDNIVSGGTWAGLTLGDTVTNNSGYTLTVDPSQQTPTGIDAGINYVATSNFGRLVISNKSTSALVWCLYTGLDFDVRNLCTVEFDNDFITLQDSGGDWTSDGSENQSIPVGSYGWIGAGFEAEDFCAGLWVEESTGVWKRWAAIRSTETALWALAGVGDLGRFFQYNDSTGAITFGDGGQAEDLTSDTDISTDSNFIPLTNADTYTQFSVGDVIHLVDDNGLQRLTIATGGISSTGITVDEDIERDYLTSDNAFVRLTVGGKIPPSGAKVRVNNFGFATLDVSGNKINSSSRANDGRIYIRTGGIIKGNNVSFFGAHLYASGAEEIDLQYVTTYRYIYPYNSLLFTMDELISTMDFFDASLTYSMYLRRCHNGLLKDSTVVNEDYVYGPLYFDQLSQFDVKNSFICTYNRSSNPYNGSLCRIGNTTIKNVDFTECDLVGHIIRGSKNCNLYDCRISNNVNANYKNVSGITSYNSHEGIKTVNGLASIPEGVTTGDDDHFIFGNIDNLLNVNLITHPTTDALVAGDFNGTNIINCYCSVAVDSIILMGESKIGGTVQGLSAGNIPTRVMANYSGGINAIFKQVDASLSTFTSFSTLGGVGRHFCEIRYDNVNEYGAIGLFFLRKTDNNPNAYTESETGAAKFYSDRVYMPLDNSSIIWTWPHSIKGVTSFQNVAPVVAGSGLDNFKVEFSFDNGANWYLIKDYSGSATAANLIAQEPTDMEEGFPLKIRFSRTTGSSSEYINRFYIYTNVDYENYRYAGSLVPVSITVLDADGDPVQGARVYLVESNSGAAVVFNELTDVNGEVSTIYGYNGDQEVEGWIRKGTNSPKFKQFTLGGSITSSGYELTAYMTSDE